MKLRTCSECYESLPEDEFYAADRYGTKMTRCKECHKARCRDRWAEKYGRPVVKVAAAEKGFLPLLQAWCLRR